MMYIAYKKINGYTISDNTIINAFSTSAALARQPS